MKMDHQHPLLQVFCQGGYKDAAMERKGDSNPLIKPVPVTLVDYSFLFPWAPLFFPFPLSSSCLVSLRLLKPTFIFGSHWDKNDEFTGLHAMNFLIHSYYMKALGKVLTFPSVFSLVSWLRFLKVICTWSGGTECWKLHPLLWKCVPVPHCPHSLKCVSNSSFEFLCFQLSAIGFCYAFTCLIKQPVSSG